MRFVRKASTEFSVTRGRFCLCACLTGGRGRVRLMRPAPCQPPWVPSGTSTPLTWCYPLSTSTAGRIEPPSDSGVVGVLGLRDWLLRTRRFTTLSPTRTSGVRLPYCRTRPSCCSGCRTLVHGWRRSRVREYSMGSAVVPVWRVWCVGVAPLPGFIRSPFHFCLFITRNNNKAWCMHTVALD
jgi:hypothetical protein